LGKAKYRILASAKPFELKKFASEKERKKIFEWKGLRKQTLVTYIISEIE
jgi:hypothetical protein